LWRGTGIYTVKMLGCCSSKQKRAKTKLTLNALCGIVI
jgi:hypothetical protein